MEAPNQLFSPIINNSSISSTINISRSKKDQKIVQSEQITKTSGSNQEYNNNNNNMPTGSSSGGH